MSNRSKRKESSKQPKPDHRIHPIKTARGRTYIFTDKHHHPPKGDHACWLPCISRYIEFSLFQGAETGDYGDEVGNLYNVHKNGEEYIELGTRHELLAIFWNPHSAAEWHGHPRWPLKTRDALNRKSQGYAPPKSAMRRMVQGGRVSERDADRILRGDYP